MHCIGSWHSSCSWDGESWARLPTGSGCKLCPPNWLLHTDKCYWVSKEKAPWDKSRDDCSKRRARLLMIRDQDEMAFIQTTSKDANRIWLGLTITFPARKRIWVDGSLLNQTLFKVVDPAEGNSCGVIKADQIHFETCSAVSKWICEKDEETAANPTQ
uniref:C-type lectin domain-containing protein n=1 Tax=Terrapene triunguis TaxID=2587831 RepID=A0A674J006_9SAUR